MSEVSALQRRVFANIRVRLVLPLAFPETRLSDPALTTLRDQTAAAVAAAGGSMHRCDVTEAAAVVEVTVPPTTRVSDLVRSVKNRTSQHLHRGRDRHSWTEVPAGPVWSNAYAVDSLPSDPADAPTVVRELTARRPRGRPRSGSRRPASATTEHPGGPTT